jgi:hypothetical protein
MSPIGLGSTFGIASEFTNEIYDISNDANQAAYKEGGDTWTMILGIVVTLLPKIIPRIMPSIVGEDKLKERFDDGGVGVYSNKIEHMFREKFLQNLNFVENLVRAWQDDTLDLEHFGINGNLIAEAKEDGGDIMDNFIAGEPASFQKELLVGIGFLQERIQRSEHNPDSITVIANRIWDTATALSTLISSYFN